MSIYKLKDSSVTIVIMRHSKSSIFAVMSYGTLNSRRNSHVNFAERSSRGSHPSILTCETSITMSKRTSSSLAIVAVNFPVTLNSTNTRSGSIQTQKYHVHRVVRRLQKKACQSIRVLILKIKLSITPAVIAIRNSQISDASPITDSFIKREVSSAIFQNVIEHFYHSSNSKATWSGIQAQNHWNVPIKVAIRPTANSKA